MTHITADMVLNYNPSIYLFLSTKEVSLINSLYIIWFLWSTNTSFSFWQWFLQLHCSYSFHRFVEKIVNNSKTNKIIFYEKNMAIYVILLRNILFISYSISRRYRASWRYRAGSRVRWQYQLLWKPIWRI